MNRSSNTMNLNWSFMDDMCSPDDNDELCVTHRRSKEITYDDVDYIVDTISNLFGLVGVYLSAVLTVLGVIGNMVCLFVIFCRRRNSQAYIYIGYITVWNVVYLCTASLTQVLEDGGVIRPLLTQHHLPCMLWPPLFELITHMSIWIVAALALHLTLTSNDGEKSSAIRRFQARLQCLGVTLVVIFLNYHSTLLRELISDSGKGQCSISAKSGYFYRYVWPWIKAAVGIYAPWLVICCCVPMICSRQIRSHRRILYSLIALLVWFILLTAANRLILQPYQYSLMISSEDQFRQHSQQIVRIQVLRELCSTAQHSLSFIPISLSLAFHDRQAQI